MRWGVLLGVAACGFSPSAQPIVQDGPGSATDAPMIDGPPVAACQVTATGGETVRGTVGRSTGGGSNGTLLACPPGSFVVAIALDMSNGGANSTPDRSARGIRIDCATLTIDGAGGHDGSAGSGSAGSGAMTFVDGAGGAGWDPSTLTGSALCPPGAFVSGLTAASPDTVLFEDLQLLCTTLDVQGQAVSMATETVPSSGSSTIAPSSAMCHAGEILTALSAHTGAGLDSLDVSCSPVSCVPQ